MPAHGYPALSATDAHFEQVIPCAGLTATDAKAFDLSIPQQRAATAAQKVVDGPFGNFGLHISIYESVSVPWLPNALATGWQPPKRI